MSEVESLLALYGAVDRAVAAEDVDRATLAPLLGPYRHEEAVGWYDEQFLPWIESRRAARKKTQPPGTTAASRRQDVGAALGGLAPVTFDGPRAARRLLAVSALAQAFPEHFGPDGKHADVAQAALGFRGREQQSSELHAQFAADFTDMGQWSTAVQNAVDSDLLPESFLSQQAAPPCVGRLVMRPTALEDDPEPCLVMEAEFTTADVPFAELKNYLEPANWQYPGSLWCRMEEYAPGWFHETVSTSCASDDPLWTASTDLQFWFSHPTPNEARVEYDFVPGLPVADSDIVIDEGSLRMIELPDGSVNVKTTKRVRFAGNFDGPGLAMFMCATGYASSLQDVVFTVATAKNPKSFRVPAPTGGIMTPPQTTKNAKEPGPDTLDSLITEATTFANARIKDAAATCTASLAKVQEGSYTVEHAWSDGLKLWSNALAGMTKALDLGTRAAKVVAAQSSTDGS